MRLHVTIEFLPDGSSNVLYAGQEVLLAQKALADAVAAGKSVRVDRFFNPVPVQIRYPVAEKESSTKAAQDNLNRSMAANVAKAKEAEKKLEESKRLAAEAKQMKAELATAKA